MRKNNGKASKSTRMQAILDILNRWGRLDKNTLITHLARALDDDSDSSSLERSVYRDLEELVLDNRISVDYFTRDGVLIEEFDSDVHKNFYCEWFIPTAESVVTGAKYLENLNGLIYVPKLLKSEIGISSGTMGPHLKFRNFYYLLAGEFQLIKTSYQAFQCTYLISRTNGNIFPTEINEIQEKIGKRSVILKIPDTKISSYKESSQLGHFSVKLIDDETIEVEDYGSSNGTNIYKLTSREADSIKFDGEKLNKATATSNWIVSLPDNSRIVLKKEKISMKIPAIIEIGDSFHLLIM